MLERIVYDDIVLKANNLAGGIVHIPESNIAQPFPPIVPERFTSITEPRKEGIMPPEYNSVTEPEYHGNN
ncbi:hypothetical protein JW756_05190 [Candidatus Woesearchaeota archaeon]|nr:hypothetical protein [Candidatus Woesearchaeota archaeon]